MAWHFLKRHYILHRLCLPHLLFKWLVLCKRRVSTHSHYAASRIQCPLDNQTKNKKPYIAVCKMCFKYCEAPDRNNLFCRLWRCTSTNSPQSGHLSRLALVRTASAVTRAVIAWENRCLYVRPCACMSMERRCARAQPCVLPSVRLCATWEAQNEPATERWLRPRKALRGSGEILLEIRLK